MAIYEHTQKWAGYSIKDWNEKTPPSNFETTLYRISTEYDEGENWSDKLQQYLAQDTHQQTRGLVTGSYSDEMYEEDTSLVINAIIAVKAQLPLLDSLFLNDIISEENEISWICNTDNAPLIHAFPELKNYRTRGGQNLQFKNLNAPKLQTLTVETGGLAGSTLQDIMQANLPALTHLELYLGTDEYGASYCMDDLAPLLLEGKFDHLTYLGLKNAENQDEIVKAVVQSSVIKQLITLDFSLGTLTDEGGQALLDAKEAIAHIKNINLSYHYMSDAMVKQLTDMAQNDGINLDVSDKQDLEDGEDDWRFVSIGE